MLKKTLIVNEIHFAHIERALGARLREIREAIEQEENLPRDEWSEPAHQEQDSRIARMRLTEKQVLETSEAIKGGTWESIPSTPL